MYTEREQKNKGESWHKRRVKKKKKKQKKVIISVYLCLILLLGVAAAYIWRSNYYKIHFYKDTWINGQDCSDKTASEVKELLQEKSVNIH